MPSDDKSPDQSYKLNTAPLMALFNLLYKARKGNRSSTRNHRSSIHKPSKYNVRKT